MKRIEYKKNNTGMTLVELLVAMVVGLILLGGVYTVFVGSTTTNSMNIELSRMQENGRFAMTYLNREIRQAGYMGCASELQAEYNINVGHPGAPNETDLPNTVVTLIGWNADLNDNDYYTLQNDVAVQSTESGWGSQDVAIPALDVVPDTDILQIGGALAGLSAPILKFVGAPTQFVIPKNILDIASNEWVLATDCNRAVWVGVCNISNTSVPGIPSEGLVLASGCGNNPPGEKNLAGFEGGEIVQYGHFVFYVGKRGNNALNPPSLFMKRGSQAAQEIIEGVESMQIRYGFVNSTGDFTYGTADDVDDWARVVSVRIGLLLRSNNELLRGETDDREYDVNGTKITAPEDRYLRTVMNTTIGIRNRLP